MDFFTLFYLSGLSYYVFFVKKKDKYHPKYKKKPEKIKASIKWAIISLVGNAIVVAPLHLLMLKDKTKIYYNVGDYGIGWLIISIFLYLFVTETSIYWTTDGCIGKSLISICITIIINSDCQPHGRL
ncbi:MAG: hypothetical protein R2728_13985 [Chitinophagales bacterium]